MIEPMKRRGVRRVSLCLVLLVAAIGPWAAGVSAQSGPEMTLTGILLGPTPVAIISDGEYTFISKVGEPVGDAVVVAILPLKVVLRRGNTTFDLPAPSLGRAPLMPAAPAKSAALGPEVPAKNAAPAPAGPAKRTAAVPAPPGALMSPGAGMTVTGILEGPRRVAIIEAGGESFVAGPGDPVGGAVVVSILPGKVVLKKDGALFELPIGRAAARTSSF